MAFPETAIIYSDLPTSPEKLSSRPEITSVDCLSFLHSVGRHQFTGPNQLIAASIFRRALNYTWDLDIETARTHPSYSPHSAHYSQLHFKTIVRQSNYLAIQDQLDLFIALRSIVPVKDGQPPGPQSLTDHMLFAIVIGRTAPSHFPPIARLYPHVFPSHLIETHFPDSF